MNHFSDASTVALFMPASTMFVSTRPGSTEAERYQACLGAAELTLAAIRVTIPPRVEGPLREGEARAFSRP